MIRPLHAPRSGWEEVAKVLQARTDHPLLDPQTSTRFDEEEWAR